MLKSLLTTQQKYFVMWDFICGGEGQYIAVLDDYCGWINSILHR